MGEGVVMTVISATDYFTSDRLIADTTPGARR
jgi:hypothetical protein